MNKYAVSIYNKATREHYVFDAGHFQNEIHAAYITAGNELGIDFSDDDERENFDVDEMAQEFAAEGYSIAVVQLR